MAPVSASLGLASLTVYPKHLDRQFWKTSSTRSFLVTADKWACLAVILNVNSAYKVTKQLHTGSAFLRHFPVLYLVAASAQFIFNFIAPQVYDRYRYSITISNRVSRLCIIGLLLASITLEDYTAVFVTGKVEHSNSSWRTSLHLVVTMPFVLGQNCLLFPLSFKQQLAFQALACTFAWFSRTPLVCAIQSPLLANETALACEYIQNTAYGIMYCLTEVGFLLRDYHMPVCHNRGGEVLFLVSIFLLGIVFPLYMSYQVEMTSKLRFLEALPHVQLGQQIHWRPRIWHHAMIMVVLAVLCYVLAETITVHSTPLACPAT